MLNTLSSYFTGDIIAALVIGFIGAILAFFVLPKFKQLLKKYVSKDELESAANIIEKIQAVKEKFDLDPNREDPIEKTLRFADLAVSAASQELDDDKSSGKDKKNYAMDLAKSMLLTYKEHQAKNGEKVNITETEEKIMSGLIETAVGYQKKQALLAATSKPTQKKLPKKSAKTSPKK